MKRLIIFLLVSLIGMQSIAQSNDLIDSISSCNFKVSYSINDIDKKFLSYLKSVKKIDFKIVNRYQIFNESDAIDRNLPNKRLVFFAKSEGGIQTIVYEQGGNAKQLLCLIYKKIKKKQYLFELLRLEVYVSDLESLKKSISDRKFFAFGQ